MNLLFFIIRHKIRHFLTDIGIKVSIKIFGMIFIVLFGIITGYAIDIIVNDDNLKLHYDRVVLWLIIIISGFFVFSEFFPMYKSVSDIVLKIYPIHSLKKWFINIIYDFLQLKSIAILTFISFITFSSVRYSLSDFIKSIAIFLISFLSVQTLKRIIEHKQNQAFYKYYWILSNLIPIYIIYFYGIGSNKTMVILMLCLIVHLFLSYLIFDNTIEISSSSYPFNRTFLDRIFGNANYLAFINNYKSKSAFFIQLIFKVSFLPLFQFEFFQLFSNDFLLFQFISPIMIFTYWGNNLYGFFSTIWVNSIVIKPLSIFKIYFQLMIVPIILDLIISLILIFILDKFSYRIVLFYLISISMLLVNGLYFTVNKPMKVEKGIVFSEMKNNVNTLSLFSSYVIVIISFYISQYPYLILLFIIICFTSAFILVRDILARENNIQYHIFETIK
jgi:hypothetical protein